MLALIHSVLKQASVISRVKQHFKTEQHFKTFARATLTERHAMPRLFRETRIQFVTTPKERFITGISFP